MSSELSRVCSVMLAAFSHVQVKINIRLETVTFSPHTLLLEKTAVTVFYQNIYASETYTSLSLSAELHIFTFKLTTETITHTNSQMKVWV